MTIDYYIFRLTAEATTGFAAKLALHFSESTSKLVLFQFLGIEPAPKGCPSPYFVNQVVRVNVAERISLSWDEKLRNAGWGRFLERFGDHHALGRAHDEVFMILDCLRYQGAVVRKVSPEGLIPTDIFNEYLLQRTPDSTQDDY